MPGLFNLGWAVAARRRFPHELLKLSRALHSPLALVRYPEAMSDIVNEPVFDYFSHVRRALAAIGLAALGALVMVVVLPMLAGLAKPQPVAETVPERVIPQGSVSK